MLLACSEQSGRNYAECVRPQQRATCSASSCSNVSVMLPTMCSANHAHRFDARAAINVNEAAVEQLRSLRRCRHKSSESVNSQWASERAVERGAGVVCGRDVPMVSYSGLNASAILDEPKRTSSVCDSRHTAVTPRSSSAYALLDRHAAEPPREDSFRTRC
jgi:hypothetical protein